MQKETHGIQLKEQTARVGMSISAAKYKQLTDMAHETGRTITRTIVDLLTEYGEAFLEAHRGEGANARVDGRGSVSRRARGEGKEINDVKAFLENMKKELTQTVIAQMAAHGNKEDEEDGDGDDSSRLSIMRKALHDLADEWAINHNQLTDEQHTANFERAFVSFLEGMGNGFVFTEYAEGQPCQVKSVLDECMDKARAQTHRFAEALSHWEALQKKRDARERRKAIKLEDAAVDAAGEEQAKQAELTI